MAYPAVRNNVMLVPAQPLRPLAPGKVTTTTTTTTTVLRKVPTATAPPKTAVSFSLPAAPPAPLMQSSKLPVGCCAPPPGGGGCSCCCCSRSALPPTVSQPQRGHPPVPDAAAALSSGLICVHSCLGNCEFCTSSAYNGHCSQNTTTCNAAQAARAARGRLPKPPAAEMTRCCSCCCCHDHCCSPAKNGCIGSAGCGATANRRENSCCKGRCGLDCRERTTAEAVSATDSRKSSLHVTIHNHGGPTAIPSVSAPPGQVNIRVVPSAEATGDTAGPGPYTNMPPLPALTSPPEGPFAGPQLPPTKVSGTSRSEALAREHRSVSSLGVWSRAKPSVVEGTPAAENRPFLDNELSFGPSAVVDRGASAASLGRAPRQKSASMCGGQNSSYTACSSRETRKTPAFESEQRSSSRSVASQGGSRPPSQQHSRRKNEKEDTERTTTATTTIHVSIPLPTTITSAVECNRRKGVDAPATASSSRRGSALLSPPVQVSGSRSPNNSARGGGRTNSRTPGSVQGTPPLPPTAKPEEYNIGSPSVGRISSRSCRRKSGVSTEVASSQASTFASHQTRLGVPWLLERYRTLAVTVHGFQWAETTAAALGKTGQVATTTADRLFFICRYAGTELHSCSASALDSSPAFNSTVCFPTSDFKTIRLLLVHEDAAARNAGSREAAVSRDMSFAAPSLDEIDESLVGLSVKALLKLDLASVVAGVCSGSLLSNRPQATIVESNGVYLNVDRGNGGESSSRSLRALSDWKWYGLTPKGLAPSMRHAFSDVFFQDFTSDKGPKYPLYVENARFAMRHLDGTTAGWAILSIHLLPDIGLGPCEMSALAFRHEKLPLPLPEISPAHKPIGAAAATSHRSNVSRGVSAISA